MKNSKLVLLLIVLNNFGASQQQCRSKNSDIDVSYPPDQIILLESNDTHHSKINDRFKKFYLENSEYPYDELATECQLKVEDIIKYSQEFPNNILISLYVSDFYQNNYNKVRESLVYAGDINGSETNVTACKFVYKLEGENETCKYFNDVRKKYVKLGTTQLLEAKYNELFKKVLEFQPNKIKNLWIPIELPIKKQLNVIVCGKNIINSHDYDGFKINSLDICNDDDPSFLKSVKDDTLAILAPTGFNIIRPIDNPVVFYGESYVTKETEDWFKNSITAVPWQSLKYGFLFFIKKMEWMRVAIISDSSEYSREFEEELTKLFRENGIACIAETCITTNCGKIIDKINENGAKIIIANFNLENMKTIASYTKSKKIMRARNVIWITRDLSMKEAKEAANMLNSDVFNISFEKNLTYILQTLNTIRSRIHVNCSTEPCSFSKNEAAKKLKELLKTSKININSITKHHYIQHYVGYIVIENHNITKEYFNYPNHIEDSVINCIVRNNTFKNPCNDTELVLLMVILTVFFLTVLGVMLFFQSPELENSYRQLH